MKLSIQNISILIALAATLALMAYVFEGAKPVRAAGPVSTVISAATTTNAFAITTSARVLATTTNPVDPANSYTRVYASICNPNANPVVLNMDKDKAADLSQGKITTVIAAAAGYNACYEITDRNQYSGSITASSTNQTSTTITVKDYVQ